jgi:hypothetical protein
MFDPRLLNAAGAGGTTDKCTERLGHEVVHLDGDEILSELCEPDKWEGNGDRREVFDWRLGRIRTFKPAENVESVGVIVIAIQVGGFVCGGNENLLGDTSDKLDGIRIVSFVE